MWRCANNNLWGYCTGEPEWEQEPGEHPIGKTSDTYRRGGVCKLDPKTCGKFQAFTEQVRPEELPDLTGYTHKIVIAIREVAKKEVAKKKAGKESAQRSLF